MNKKGSVLIYGLMLGLTIMVLALALAPSVKEFTDSARNNTTIWSYTQDSFSYLRPNEDISGIGNLSCTNESVCGTYHYLGLLKTPYYPTNYTFPDNLSGLHNYQIEPIAETFGLTTLSNAQNVSNLNVRIYGRCYVDACNNDYIHLNITINGTTYARGLGNFGSPNAPDWTYGWMNFTQSGNWSQSDLDNMQVSLGITYIADSVEVMGLYVETNYTETVLTGEEDYGLGCSNSSISNFQKAACYVTDMNLFYFIGALLFIGGAVVVAKLLFTD